MNICTLTAKILYSSRQLNHKSQVLSQVIICVPNFKKQLQFYKIKTIAKGRLSDYLLEISANNGYLLIEGFIYIQKSNILNNLNLNQMKKNINIRIHKIHYLI